MASYSFCFRASTRNEVTAGRLYFRVVHGCESRSVTTSYRIFPEEWDFSGRCLKIPYRQSARGRELSDIESSMMCDMRRMDMVIREFERLGVRYTADELMSRYRSVMTGNTLCTYAEKLASEMELEGSVRTASTYRTAVARFRSFNGGMDLSMDQLSPSLLGSFQQFLRSEGRSPNTISFYMRALRAIYHKSVADGRTMRRSENVFAGVYTGVSTSRKFGLSSEELAVLSALDPTSGSGSVDRRLFPEYLDRALALFLFCYHARGMSFSDVAYLRKSDLTGDRIGYRRHKTGQHIEIKVLPVMRRIIDWFAPHTSGSEYVFPIITDPVKSHLLQYNSGLRLQNQRLNKIAALCGIRKHLSTNSARHSWATVAKGAGLPLAFISEGLGHLNQKTTEIYLSSLERSVLDHASHVVSEAISPGHWSRGASLSITDDVSGLVVATAVTGSGSVDNIRIPLRRV